MRRQFFSLQLKTIGLIGMFFLFSSNCFAVNYSSSNFVVKDPVVTSGSQSATSSNFKLNQSVSQVASGKSSSGSFQLWSGFQYYFTASSNTLSATAGNAQVSLSWTIPQTFLGANVGSYEVGVGTASGGETYTSVGSVTSYTQTGLTNNTTYYFKIKAKTLAGTVLTYSNEVSAVPVATTSNNNGGGGAGGGGSYTGVVVFNGYAAPDSKVVILQNGNQVGATQSNSSGYFQITAKGLSIGEGIFAIYFIDTEGTRSDFVNVKVVVSEISNAVSGGIFLPPTLKADKVEVQAGGGIKFWGYTLPSAAVSLERQGVSSGQSLSDKNGRYEIPFQTQGIAFGTQVMRSKAILGNSATPFSNKLSFLIGSKDVETPHIGSCPARADFNSDCRVDLVDFSILAYWFKKTNVPPEIDLNSDGVVDLIDFSILAYYWTV